MCVVCKAYWLPLLLLFHGLKTAAAPFAQAGLQLQDVRNWHAREEKKLILPVPASEGLGHVRFLNLACDKTDKAREKEDRGDHIWVHAECIPTEEL